MEVAIIKQPNSLCKNEKCRKAFYACAFCTHTNAWRSVACSIECYNAYVEQVQEARKNSQNVDLMPERTDMNEEQMDEFMSKPLEEVIEITKDELKDYADDVESVGFGGTVDKINDEIRNAENASGADFETFTEESTSVRKGRKTKTTNGI